MNNFMNLYLTLRSCSGYGNILDDYGGGEQHIECNWRVQGSNISNTEAVIKNIRKPEEAHVSDGNYTRMQEYVERYMNLCNMVY
jgi:hypothetical protein